MTTAILFYIFAVLAGVSAIGVAVSRNIVRAAVCLFFTLVSAAALYFLLHAEFLAAVQLVVYAGGTLILIVFGVMLTSSAPSVSYQPRRVEVLFAMLLGVAMLVVLVLATIDWLAKTPLREAAMTADYPIQELGVALLGDYLLPFELVSVVLLVVMIGAAYLAKVRRRETDDGAEVRS